MWLSIRHVSFAAIVTLALSTGTTLADSKYEASARGNVELRDGPGWRYQVIGWLKDGAKFRLRDCTDEHGWCLVVNKRKQAIGWAQADSLSGVSAKAQVTPWKPLYDPFRDGWPRKRQHIDQP